jgi:hypothetical protein
MQGRRSRVLRVAVAGVVGAGVVGASVVGAGAVEAIGVDSAHAGSQATSASVTHVVATRTFGKPKGPVQFAGAIGDYGQGEYVNASGHADPEGNDYKIVMKHGDLTLNVTKLNARLQASQPVFFNSTTCSGALKVAAPAPILSGTGDYTSAHGTFQLSVYSEFVVPRFTSGAKKGRCNVNSKPAHAVSAISGQGQITG